MIQSPGEWLQVISYKDLTSFTALRALKKGSQRAYDFNRQNDHIDKQDAEEHHHGIFLHLFGTFGCFFFQVVLFNLAHVKYQHFEIHLLVIAAQGTD